MNFRIGTGTPETSCPCSARVRRGPHSVLSLEAASRRDVSAGRASSGSSGPHLARSRLASPLPSARPAPEGCWLPRAFSCRARRPTRFPGDRTGCPIGGTGPGACRSRESLEHHRRLAWHPPYLLRASPSCQRTDPEPGPLAESPDLARSLGLHRGEGRILRLARDRLVIRFAGWPEADAAPDQARIRHRALLRSAEGEKPVAGQTGG